VQLGHGRCAHQLRLHTISADPLIDVNLPLSFRVGLTPRAERCRALVAAGSAAFLGTAALLSVPSVLAATPAPAATPPAPPQAGGSLFGASEVVQERFVLVAAPIGKGERSQLNIYEQLNTRRPCFAVGEGKPAPVNPLLASFDFTGICSRYIDANGYSVRVGGSDLATSYRLSVTQVGNDTHLLALPTRAGAGPELVVARTQGLAQGFVKLQLEPGWKIMRRQFRGRNLGHVYLYIEAWPGAQAAVVAPALAPPQAAAGKTAGTVPKAPVTPR
jgi:hypothetical protein